MIDTHDVPYVSAQNWHTVPSAIVHKRSQMVKSKVTSGEIPPSVPQSAGVEGRYLRDSNIAWWSLYVVVSQFLSVFPQEIQASFYCSSPPFKINCGI